MSALRIATRKSALALWQARHVAQLLTAVGAERVELVEMTTEGDRFLSAPLSAIGGKGLFVKEIERALLDGRADLAVHSLKDLTSFMPAELCLAAIPEREDPRDAWVSPRGIPFEALPKGARVGTSSLRRTAQVKEKRPDLEVVSLRGNVQSRLRKTADSGLEGCILALAGLRRLGLEGEVTSVLSLEQSLPAVGQGALALQCRAEDAEMRALLAQLDHGPTRIAVSAERALLARLEGGCSVPLAGHAELDGERLRLRGLVGRPDGTKVVRAERLGRADEAERLGLSLAEALLEAGGKEILRDFGHPSEKVPES